uniref:Cysteine proteinase n=2 Tax=Haemonchus contortus TaxID=6289 RepID=Q25028_HAECO|nr:cysteine proteinase [Haemonchus contortus]
MKYLVLALCIYLSQAAVLPEADVLTEEIPLQAQVLSGDELLEYLKKNQRLFEVEATPAGHNFDRKLMDLSFINQNRKPVFDDKNDKGEDIPESFDARTKWPKCSSLKHIRDQANCGSCWAVSTASALSDRICIASNGRKQVHVSATDILSCCGNQCGYGCNGGWPIQAFNYFSKQGAVTGGDYKATSGCRPYPFHPCGHHGKDTYYGECPNEATTPKCVRKCQKSYKKSYKKDRSIGKDAYEVPNSEKAIQREIMKNGPVVGAFTVYEDFSYYKKGIYKHTAGKARGGHAIKIIGWGKEGGVPYWLIANSWHNDWGENGYFRILRGSNHCGIEENVVAGHV